MSGLLIPSGPSSSSGSSGSSSAPLVAQMAAGAAAGFSPSRRVAQVCIECELKRCWALAVAGMPAPTPDLVARIEARVPDNFSGKIWFDSDQQANDYANGLGEGMGFWNSSADPDASPDWVNLASLHRTIVMGEYHDAVRNQLVTALNIGHRLVEAATERSLDGVPLNHIPPGLPGRFDGAYVGDTQHKALENYWLRMGGYMARYVDPIVAELRMAIDLAGGQLPDSIRIDPLEHHEELIELIGTLTNMQAPLPGANATQRQQDICETLERAITYAAASQIHGAIDLANEQPAGHGNTAKRACTAAIWRLLTGKDVNGTQVVVEAVALDKLVALELNLRLLSNEVQGLGELQFQAMASPAVVAADALTVIATQAKAKRGELLTGHEVWGPRREVAMLANLKAALLQQPPPMLVTMGNVHAESLKNEISALPAVHLFSGSLKDLVDLGKAPSNSLPPSSGGPPTRLRANSVTSAGTQASSLAPHP